MRYSNFWKCIEVVNPTISMLFYVIFNLMIPSGRTFLTHGGGGGGSGGMFPTFVPGAFTYKVQNHKLLSEILQKIPLPPHIPLTLSPPPS